MLKTNFGIHTKQKTTPLQEYISWQEDPSDDNYEKLFEQLKPTVNTALTSFGGGDKTLKTRANILTAKAIKSYDANKGASLKTHVYTTLQRLKRFNAERGRVVHIPENVRLDNNMIDGFMNEYRDKNRGVDPSIAEISDGTGLSKIKVKRATIQASELPTSFMETEKGDILNFEDRSEAAIWKDYVYHDLDNIGKKIFEHTTGYMGSKVLPKKEIAAKLKITPAAVSSRINTITKRLQQVP